MPGRTTAIDAVQRGQLVDWADATVDDPSTAAAERELAERARRACRRIGEDVHAERQRLVGVLAEAGVGTPTSGPAEPAQRHEMIVPIELDDLDAAVAALTREGYQQHIDLSAGAERSRRSTGNDLVVRRSDDVTTVVRLRWREPSAPTRSTRITRPTFADWTVPLPEALWWAYPAVRVGRLAARSIGLDRRDHALLEPFLATPTSLLDPLFDAAGVDAADVVVDLGCGDGRIVVEAARRRGCRAIGVERSPDLVEAARNRSAAAGTDDRVDIIEGDGLDVDLGDATVVFLFLPSGIAQNVVPALLERLGEGARILVHEQSRLPTGLVPDASQVVIAENALTVAHLWTVRRPTTPAT